MGDRTPIVVGILAIAGVVAWLLVSGGDPDAPKANAPPSGPSAHTTPAKTAVTEPPSLPAKPALAPEAVPAAPTANEVFETESRDDAWAKTTEAELAKRWKKIRGAAVESTECHASQCRVIVTGSEQDVGKTVADLEGSRGLHGFADKGVHLTAPEINADGTVALKIFVRFDR
jgi:hypothetical protein